MGQRKPLASRTHRKMKVRDQSSMTPTQIAEQKNSLKVSRAARRKEENIEKHGVQPNNPRNPAKVARKKATRAKYV